MREEDLLLAALAEEASALALNLATGIQVQAGAPAFALLESASGNIPDRVKEDLLAKASSRLRAWSPLLNAYAAERAAALAEDHSRVRKALGSRAYVRVEAITPADVIGLYVLLPRL